MPLDRRQFNRLLQHAEAEQFDTEDYETAKALFQSYTQLLAALKDKQGSLARIREQFLADGGERPMSQGPTSTAESSTEHRESGTRRESARGQDG